MIRERAAAYDAVNAAAYVTRKAQRYNQRKAAMSELVLIEEPL